MTLYRAEPKHGVAWITGGSAGLGRALAAELAAEGYSVVVTGLEKDSVQPLMAETAHMPGSVVSIPCDVTDEAGMAAVVVRIEEEVGPIVLAVLNAGNYLPSFGENLKVSDFRQTFAVNYMGVIHGLVPVVERMRQRARGHIVLMGSVSAYFGWPSTGAYGGSKAALNILAQSLRYDFDKMNIRIQIMNPGFVDTHLTQKNHLPMPGLMPVGRAARRLTKGIKRGGFEVTFPRRLTWLVKVLGIMPQPVIHWVTGTATRWKSRPLRWSRKPAASEAERS